MSDSIDITMEDVVAQYRDELISVMGEKLMLQAAVKILGEKITEMQQQIRQLTEDLGTAVNEVARLEEVVEKTQKAAAIAEEDLEDAALPLRPVPMPPTQHIQYQHRDNDVGG